MLILQRMATSSSFLSTPLLKASSSFPTHFLSPLKHCVLAPSTEFRALALSRNRNGVSTSSAAVATETQVSTQDDKLKETQMEKSDKLEKVVLPTNESSESLLRIRHTVLYFAFEFFLLLFF